jgi:hypothetical protein
VTEGDDVAVSGVLVVSIRRDSRYGDRIGDRIGGDVADPARTAAGRHHDEVQSPRPRRISARPIA